MHTHSTEDVSQVIRSLSESQRKIACLRVEYARWFSDELLNLVCLHKPKKSRGLSQKKSRGLFLNRFCRPGNGLLK